MSSARVVEAAWQEPYQSTGNMLESVLEEYMCKENADRFARYASIVQSSGTDKSRMVDELAKKIFCIPITIGSNTGYPPADTAVVSYLMGSVSNSLSKRVQLFFDALFEIALERAKVIASELKSEGNDTSDLAGRFRQLMSEGMRYGKHGQYRQKFYESVCQRATEPQGAIPRKLGRPRFRRQNRWCPSAAYRHRAPVSRGASGKGEVRHNRSQCSPCISYLRKRFDTALYGVQRRAHLLQPLHKVESVDVVNQQYLLLAISRGAAIICADQNAEIDFVIPILLGTALKKENVTAILVQAKNSRHYGARIHYPLFKLMDPYTCGLFNDDVKEPLPILRMVFALASPEAAVASPAIREQQSPRRDKTAEYTAYDIWCAGASHKTFDVIQEDEDGAFAELLKAIGNAREDPRGGYWYLSDFEQTAMRHMQPAALAERESFELFADVEGIGEYALAEYAEEDVDDDAEYAEGSVAE
ncbi:hypothetical protein NUW54_g11655 [Trametes sanguinea]|uniref:Uncharacterized protein n=1 Tax=Trametes sanguinea TaxID=158606 RepID=A0ACC1NBP8_9APHY|nr:hypothetical protein NUW54_g11655 [Trametes sanguinea]